MKKFLLLTFLTLCMSANVSAATDLMQVFSQALTSDPTYQQAISQRLSTR